MFYRFVNIDKCLSLSFYIDLPKLWYVFLALCQTKQAEVSPRFQSLMKLLLWTKVVERVKVLNALGPLCLWQCFNVLCIFCWLFPCSDTHAKSIQISRSKRFPNFCVVKRALCKKIRWKQAEKSLSKLEHFVVGFMTNDTS